MEREDRAGGGGQSAQPANRAALLTPPGAAAIAVVRLRGPGVKEFLARHFSRLGRAGRCVHGELVDGERVIDDPVVVLSEDGLTADINVHGGVWVVHECLELARREGFEVVEARGDLLDARDQIEREMVEALPLARTEQALRMLLAQPQQWAKLPGKADIQDRVETASDPELDARRAELKRTVDDHCLWWMLHPPTVAIVGIPNVGKSTLANSLFGQQRSITADLPGTTRDWVGDWANLDGLPVHLLDTPGQRQSSDPIEQAAIARSQAEIDGADLVIIVLDPTQPLEPQQAQILSRYPNSISVMNKSDLPAVWDAKPVRGIEMVATSGVGADALRAAICEHFDCTDLTPQRPRWWTARQRDYLIGVLRDVQQ
jgi:tRNA modification GTPase